MSPPVAVPLRNVGSADAEQPEARRCAEEMLRLHRAGLVALLRTWFREALYDDELEDCVYSAVLRFLERRHSFDTTRPGLLTWLAIVARRAAIDLLREEWRHARAREVPLRNDARGNVAGDENSGDTDPEGPSEASCPRCIPELVALREILVQLPARQYTVLMKSLEGADSQEIAAALGICPSTVRTHLERAREAISAGLLKRGFHVTDGWYAALVLPRERTRSSG